MLTDAGETAARSRQDAGATRISFKLVRIRQVSATWMHIFSGCVFGLGLLWSSLGLLLGGVPRCLLTGILLIVTSLGATFGRTGYRPLPSAESLSGAAFRRAHSRKVSIVSWRSLRSYLFSKATTSPQTRDTARHSSWHTRARSST